MMEEQAESILRHRILQSTILIMMSSFIVFTMYKTIQVKNQLGLGRSLISMDNDSSIIIDVRSLSKSKRNILTENLPWICETRYEWKDLGANYYPRFVRTAECKTKYCIQGFFKCQAKNYKMKVLKKLTLSHLDSAVITSNHGDNETVLFLPEPLQNEWQLITLNLNLCCECTNIRRKQEQQEF